MSDPTIMRELDEAGRRIRHLTNLLDWRQRDLEAAQEEKRDLVEQFETLRDAALENAEHNAISYHLAYVLGLRPEWAGASGPPDPVDASSPASGGEE